MPSTVTARPELATEVERLRDMLERRGLEGVRPAARALHYNPSTVSRWLRGLRRVPAVVWAHLEEIPVKRRRRAGHPKP